MYIMRGMGDAAQTVQASGGIAAPVAAAAGGASVAGILGVSLAVAVPVIGAAIAGITLLAVALIKNSGCGQTCIETSSWANQAAALLDQNIATYFAQSPRTQSQQAAALANFDAIWARLVQMCSDASTGTAGQHCISDRQAGACTWKQTANKVPPWGTPAAGECWNWFAGYRDPIANDPNVVADSAVSLTSSALDSQVALPGGSSVPAWALLAAAVAALFLVKG